MSSHALDLREDRAVKETPDTFGLHYFSFTFGFKKIERHDTRKNKNRNENNHSKSN